MKAMGLKRAVRQVLNGFVRDSVESDVRERKSYSPAELQRYQVEFENWQRRNPSKAFKDYYSENVKNKLAAGSARSNVSGIPYQWPSGARELNQLVDYGLRPSDTCVEYGCGTLRVGLHVINYLGRGAFWGLDISDCLFADAKKIVGEKIIDEKEPRLREILPESIVEVAAAKPDMLYSVKVMQHVHPNELAEYFGNIMKIIGSSGQAIISSKWRDHETTQYRPSGWAHAISTIEALIDGLDGKVAVLKAREKVLPLDGAGTAKTGILRIAHKSSRVWAG